MTNATAINRHIPGPARRRFRRGRAVCRARGLSPRRQEKEKYDDARMRRAVDAVKTRPEWSGNNYNLFTHNCQDFVSAVIDEYNKQGRRQ